MRSQTPTKFSTYYTNEVHTKAYKYSQYENELKDVE